MVSLSDKPRQENHLFAKLGFLKSFSLCQTGKAISAHGIRLLRYMYVKTRALTCTDKPDTFLGNTRVM